MKQTVDYYFDKKKLKKKNNIINSYETVYFVFFMSLNIYTHFVDLSCVKNKLMSLILS